jgi:hypothetical protein
MGRDASLAPGDAVLGWTAENIIGHAEGDTSIIRVPAAEIRPMVRDMPAGIHRRIPAGTDVLRLLRHHTRVLQDCPMTPELQRLAYAHRLLTDPRQAGEKIASIAFAAGFGDLAYFYRVFRRRYDALRTDIRAQTTSVR